MIGLTIGATSDKSKPDYQTLESFDPVSMEKNSMIINTTVDPGKEIIVITRDEQTIWGKFQGTTGEDDNLALKISGTLSGGTIAIPIRNVSRIQIKNSKNGTLTGFLVGAVIDGVIVVVVIHKVFDDVMGAAVGGINIE
ncbi:MAG: hypothetical protein KDH97_24595 [Calditrichaeota bacterium]|nr:hypothetical protein [Calditrichota bacterium]MCB0302978.1 hypothetical protein [Calditrichota bacterium]MCB9090646.1 hypothetical protein [Calditrichia bacterium]